MSLLKLNGKFLTLLAPRLTAAILLGVGVALLRSLPLAGALALAVGLILVRPPRAVWLTGLPALFLLGMAGILGGGHPLLEVLVLAGGLIALGSVQWVLEQRRWHAALDAFAQRELAALRADAAPGRTLPVPHGKRVRKAVRERV